MFDLALNSQGNLYLTEGQELATVADGPEVAQSCGIILKTQQGEWFLNESEGIDHLGKVLARPFRPGHAAREIRRGLRAVEEVQDITGITVELDPDIQYKINAEIDIMTDYGAERLTT
ncbi:MAG: hypothetical protein IV090_24680 [Candidatus Sericytochromatia bacterium]|nr:hypothetical protein [Candidatus Sericytochromatia bacterium]